MRPGVRGIPYLYRQYWRSRGDYLQGSYLPWEVRGSDIFRIYYYYICQKPVSSSILISLASLPHPSKSHPHNLPEIRRFCLEPTLQNSPYDGIKI